MKDETDSSSEEEDSESDEGYADAEYTNSSEDDADDEEEWSLAKYTHWFYLIKFRAESTHGLLFNENTQILVLEFKETWKILCKNLHSYHAHQWHVMIRGL